RPFLAAIGDRWLVEIEAYDVAPVGAGLDRLGGPPGKTAAEIEMIRIITSQRFGHRAKIGFGKLPGEGRQIADHRGVVEARRRQDKTRAAQLIPRRESNAPGVCEALRLAIGFDQLRSQGG